MIPVAAVGGEIRVESSKSIFGFSRDESIPVVFVPFVEGLLLDDSFEVFSNALYDVSKFVAMELCANLDVGVLQFDIFANVLESGVYVCPFPVEDVPFIFGTIIVLA